MERQQLSDRVKVGIEKASRSGKWIGNTYPYGYTGTEEGNYLVVHEEEAKIVKEIYELSLQGQGQNQIAKLLNERNIVPRAAKAYTKHGRKYKDKVTGEMKHTDPESFIWKGGAVYYILRNPIYIGKRRFKGDYIEAPAILEYSLWKKVQDNLSANRSKALNVSKNFYMLKGMLKCSRCGGNLFGRNRRDWHYECTSKRPQPVAEFCGMKNIKYHKLNNLIWDTVIDTISRSKEVRLYLKRKFEKDATDIEKLSKKIDSLSAQITDKNLRIDKVVQLYLEESIDKTRYLNIKGKLEIEISELLDKQTELETELENYKDDNLSYADVEYYLKSIEKLKKITDDK